MAKGGSDSGPLEGTWVARTPWIGKDLSIRRRKRKKAFRLRPWLAAAGFRCSGGPGSNLLEVVALVGEG